MCLRVWREEGSRGRWCINVRLALARNEGFVNRTHWQALPVCPFQLHYRPNEQASAQPRRRERRELRRNNLLHGTVLLVMF